MTQEDKELLLKDLCARLPYDVKVYLNTDMYPKWTGDYILTAIKSQEYSVQCSVKHFSCWCNVRWVKPYLLPLSSMTEEQKVELEQIKNNEDAPYYHDINDFFLKYHLDNRHLIEKGLAIDATGLNIY